MKQNMTRFSIAIITYLGSSALPAEKISLR
jgi:hypothetical protein